MKLTSARFSVAALTLICLTAIGAEPAPSHSATEFVNTREALWYKYKSPKLEEAYPFGRSNPANNAALDKVFDFSKVSHGTSLRNKRYLVENDWYAVEWHYSAINVATGRRQTESSLCLGQIENGMLVWWIEYFDDTVGELQIAGKLPLPSADEEPFPLAGEGRDQTSLPALEPAPLTQKKLSRETGGTGLGCAFQGSMARRTDQESSHHAGIGAAEPVRLYAMSAYAAGIRKPGHFLLLNYEEGQNDNVHAYIPHRHDFFELVWLPKGRGTLQSDLRTFPVEPRTLFFSSPGQIHAWQFTEPPEGQIVSFTREFFMLSSENPGFLGRLPFLHGGNIDPILQLDETEAARTDQLFMQLREAAADPAPGRDDLVRAYLVILLTRTRQALARRGRLASIPAAEDLTLAQRFRMALEEHFPDILEVGNYANLLHVSRSRLTEELRQHTGQSASEIIHDRILLEAKRLLVHSTLNISEIAYQLRFQDPSYFGRFSRRFTGLTPGRYRETTHCDQLAS